MTNEQVIEKLEKSGDLTEFSQLVALMYFNYDSISQIVVRLKELAGNANISGEVNMRLNKIKPHVDAMVKLTDKVHKDEYRAFQFGEHADQFYNLGRKFVGIDEK